MFPVFLKALVFDVDCAIRLAVIVNARNVQTGLELPEYAAGYTLEAFPGPVVLVDVLLGRDDCHVPLDAGLLDDVLTPEFLRREK